MSDLNLTGLNQSDLDRPSGSSPLSSACIMTRDRPLLLLGLWSLALAAALFTLGIWVGGPFVIGLFAVLALAKLIVGIMLVRASGAVLSPAGQASSPSASPGT